MRPGSNKHPKIGPCCSRRAPRGDNPPNLKEESKELRYGRGVGWLADWLVGWLGCWCLFCLEDLCGIGARRGSLRPRRRGETKTAPSRPQGSLGGSQDDPGRRRPSQDGPRCSQDGPKTAQDSPRGSIDGPERPQDSPGQPKRLQRWSQTTPRRLQDVPGLPVFFCVCYLEASV